MIVHNEISERSSRDFAETSPGKLQLSIISCMRSYTDSLRKDSRAALLSSKRAIDTTTASKREELLRSAVMRNSKQTSEGKITYDFHIYLLMGD